MTTRRRYFSSAVSRLLSEEFVVQLRRRGLTDSHELLTDREKEVLLLLAQGRSNKEVAGDLAVGEVKPARYFGQDLAVWRGEDGQARMVDAYCKHLGAHMGHGGKVHGNLLECPFHAWRYDGEKGVVKEIPYAKAIPPQVKRKCTRTWHIREANQWLWMWYHPEDAAPLYDVVHLPEASDPEWTPYDVVEWRIFGSLQKPDDRVGYRSS